MGTTAVWAIVFKGAIPTVKLIIAVNEILSEVKPNEGHSLRDKVDEVVIGQNNLQQQLEQRLVDHEETVHANLDRRLDEVLDYLKRQGPPI